MYDDHDMEHLLVETLLPKFGLEWINVDGDGLCMWRAILQGSRGTRISPSVDEVVTFGGEVLQYAVTHGRLKDCPSIIDEDRDCVLKQFTKKLKTNKAEAARATRIFTELSDGAEWLNNGNDEVFKTYCDVAFPWIAQILHRPIVIFNTRAKQIQVFREDNNHDTCSFALEDKSKWCLPDAIFLLKFGSFVEHTDLLLSS